MSEVSPAAALCAHLALVSAISFGGIPSVLPDVRDFVVGHGWVTDGEFANFFAIVQAVPGPNMILMMSLIGWRVAGLAGAVACAIATSGPPCIMYFAGYRLWDRFRATRWQHTVRRGLAPVTVGLVVAGGYVIARAADNGWAAVALTGAAAGLLLVTRINPLWLLGAGAILGGLGLVG
jgi:chromate transporter